MLLDPPAGWQPDWLSSPFIKEIFTALGSDNVRVVGGAVRDSLLGEPVADVDMATSHEPDETRSLLEASGLKVIPTGLQHGTVTAVRDGQSCEITTLRKDVETNGRHAVVAFTDSWQEDAARRDFTINALYLTAEGKIYDPFGGLEDLKEGKVRFIGNAQERIEEDALRMYRFFRFSARFATSLDAQGLAACEALADRASALSRERVRDELLKLLGLSAPFEYLKTMSDIGLLPYIEGEKPAIERVGQLVISEMANDAQTHVLMRLSELYAGARPPAIARYYRLSKKQELFIDQLRKAAEAFDETMDLYAFLYEFGPEVVRQILLPKSFPAQSGWLMEVSTWQKPMFPVSGADLIARGDRPGEEMGKTLKKLESRWVRSGFQLDKQQLLTGE